MLETSGEYQLFVDAATGGALCAVQTGEQTLLVEIPDTLSCGEANISACEFDGEGNLHVSFHRGSFAGEAAVARAVEYAARVIDDVQTDVRESLYRDGNAAVQGGIKSGHEILVFIEGTNDNPEFSHRVRDRLLQLNPDLADVVTLAPSLQGTPDHERNLYLAGESIHHSRETRTAWLAQIARCGHKTDSLDLGEAFAHVRLVTVAGGAVLIEAGEPSNFVYVPVDDGLDVMPLGGYASHPSPAWVPVGNTGVIRGAERNATVLARNDLSLLMIPKETYLRHWHNTYTLAEFITLAHEQSPARLEAGAGSEPRPLL